MLTYLNRSPAYTQCPATDIFKVLLFFEIIIASFPLPLFSEPSHILLFAIFQIIGPCFSLIVLLYTCMYIHPKYNLLGLYNFTCMYSFRAGHLVLDTSWYALSWRRLFHSQHASLACASLCSIEALWALPCSL